MSGVLCLLAASSALVVRPTVLSSASATASRVAVTPPLMVAPTASPERSATSTADLKQELIRASLKFREAQEQQWEAEAAASDEASQFTLGREGEDTSAVQPSDERFKSPLPPPTAAPAPRET